MIRKLWLRFVLWNNDYCPKHGPKRQSFGMAWCLDCDTVKKNEHNARLRSYASEVNQ